MDKKLSEDHCLKSRGVLTYFHILKKARGKDIKKDETYFFLLVFSYCQPDVRFTLFVRCIQEETILRASNL